MASSALGAPLKAELQPLFVELAHKDRAVRDEAASKLQRAVGVGEDGGEQMQEGCAGSPLV